MQPTNSVTHQCSFLPSSLRLGGGNKPSVTLRINLFLSCHWWLQNIQRTRKPFESMKTQISEEAHERGEINRSNETICAHRKSCTWATLARCCWIISSLCALHASNANRLNSNKSKSCLLCRLLCYICTLNLIQAIICLLYVQCSWWMIPTGLTTRTRRLIWRTCSFGGKSELGKRRSGLWRLSLMLHHTTHLTHFTFRKYNCFEHCTVCSKPQCSWGGGHLAMGAGGSKTQGMKDGGNGPI